MTVTTMPYIKIPSANYDSDRRGMPISILVIHHTNVADFSEALNLLTRPEHGVSAHYAIDKEGGLYSLVDEAHRAWHAGKSSWRGITDVNSASIGIEVDNCPGVLYTEAQLTTLKNLCLDIIVRYQIKPWNVVAHSDIAPLRKEDPGLHFPWQEMAEVGVGMWVDATPNPEYTLTKEVFHEAHKCLTGIGYDLPPDMSEDDKKIVLKAFQMHYCPTEYGQSLNAKTFATMQALYKRINS